MKPRFILPLMVAAAALVPVVRADLSVGLSADIRLGHALPPPPPEVVVVESGPAEPPPWAESHWFRRSYAYYYYPGCDVYYRPSDRVWFYLDGGTWRAGAQLPTGIRIDFDHAVSLSLETARPYIFHEKVVAYYPANYFARVRIKHGRDRHADRKEDDRDDDHGRERGKDRKD
ncbi:MAG: hypothetical protein ACHQ5A_07500 [Opitutales bacterium]